MKQLLFFVVLVLFAAACVSQKKAVNGSKVIEVEKIESDSIEYDLKTFDGRFESWYLLQYIPSMFRSQEYYELWNQQYINAWNTNSVNPQRRWYFEPIIGYDPTVDYGLELNHKLFYYFQYVENVLNMKILTNGPRALIF